MSDYRNEHTNKIAMDILENEYGDYPKNWWHYDSEYKMLLEAQTQAWKQANEAAEKNEQALNLPFVINCKATTHELKTWIPYYKAVVGGVKQFEVRKDDRNFKEGDILHLREWDNTLKEYTGRDTKMGIRYILKGGVFGVQKGYVIMGLCCL